MKITKITKIKDCDICMAGIATIRVDFQAACLDDDIINFCEKCFKSCVLELIKDLE